MFEGFLYEEMEQVLFWFLPIFYDFNSIKIKWKAIFLNFDFFLGKN